MLQSIDESEKSEMHASVIENKNASGIKAALVDKDQRLGNGRKKEVKKRKKEVKLT
jgi:hypothetical protein